MAASDELTDAHEWIVLAIAAGHTATRGAGPIRVHVGEASSVSFAGVSLTLERLEQLEQGLTAPSNSDDPLTDDLLHLLDLASNAARSLGAALEIESLGHGSCLTLRVDADGQRQLDHSTLPLNDTGLRVSVLGGRDRQSERERELIHERCWLTSTTILLDDEPISRGPAAAFDQPKRTAKILLHGRELGEAALERLGGEPGKAFIVSRGVLVETVTLPDCSAGFVAVADSICRSTVAPVQSCSTSCWVPCARQMARSGSRQHKRALAAGRRSWPWPWSARWS